MSMENIIALDKIAEVLGDSECEEVLIAYDLTMSDAYKDSVDSAEKVKEIIKELEKKAAAVKTENPEVTPVKSKNMYTDKLILDESVNDFNINYSELSDESDEDEYLDYDMFDFVYGIVTDDWPRPKNPLGRPMRKFQHTGSDDYLDDDANRGSTQVSTDRNGNVVVYANDASAFRDVKEVCDFYHITYGEVEPRRSKDAYWAFNLTINVPSTSDGYPMMAEDFFSQYGLTMSDVIEDHKVGGGKVGNWGSTYERRADKAARENDKFANDYEVKNIYDKYVTLASLNGNVPLETFITDMFNELTAKGLTYSRINLKREFMNEFNDDFEDEE